MDADMRGKITMGMMVGCLVLAMVAMFTTSWLTTEETDDGPETNSSMTTMYMDAESSAGCELALGFYTMADIDAECDGSVMSVAFSDICDATDDDDMCDTATAGTVGTICMWLGIVMALVMVLMAVLPMAGVDAMDNLPDMVGMIASWAAGGLMILGIALWLLLLPDGDASLGYSAYLAGVAGLMGLGSTAMNTFMADE